MWLSLLPAPLLMLRWRYLKARKSAALAKVDRANLAALAAFPIIPFNADGVL